VWTGGAKKPDLSSAAPTCKNFHPKQSDLVLTGVAESEYRSAGVVIDNEAQVLKTARMVQLDWRRSVLAPGLVSCLRSHLARSAPANAKIVSIGKLPFPRVAPDTAAFRLVLEMHAGGTTLRMFIDFLLFGGGRTEVTLTSVAPYDARAAVKLAEVRLARLLASRIRA
jgi:hypothetical protein